jgi:hypothetical protein
MGGRARVRRLGQGVCALLGIAVLAGLWGCGGSGDKPALETGSTTPTTNVVEGVTMVIRYSVNAVMKNTDGITSETTQEVSWESYGTITYDPATRTYKSQDFSIRFSPDFKSVESVSGSTANPTETPIATWRGDSIEAEDIPYEGVVEDYAYFETYEVYRLTNPCSHISALRYLRGQKTPSAEDVTVMVDFETWLDSFSCDADSYLEVAILDPQFRNR